VAARVTEAAAPAPRAETLDACPLCGSRSRRRWVRGVDRSHRIDRCRYEYSRCTACGALFESTRPSERDVVRYYPTDYYGGRQSTPRPPNAASRQLARALAALDRRIASRIADPLPVRLRLLYAKAPFPGARFLDYGCGGPTFLDAMRAKGWETIGVDFSDHVLDEVERAGHLAVQANQEAVASIADASVALVRMNQVVEHLYAPRPVFATLRAKVAAEGTLHITTPNAASAGARLFRTYWLGLDCPRHVIIYSPPVLEGVLRDAGFTRVESLQEVLTKDLARSFGHALHGLGVLRHERILELADRPLLDLALRVPARLAANARLADRFHCFAQP
jgi:2-polyprenyl-3-methyl-5-hydroxy-6-metoxy-1,4-benzoquinol methylase